jgi:hypothetical protein
MNGSKEVSAEFGATFPREVFANSEGSGPEAWGQGSREALLLCSRAMH